MDDFFMDDDAPAQTQQQQETTDGNEEENGAIALGDGNNEDFFAGMGTGDDGNENATMEDASGDVPDSDEKQGNDEPTFLSVWQEQRRIELQKRRDKEVEEQRSIQKQAEDDLNEFHANRQRKIEAKQKENRDKEDGLKQDLNSVFKNGTIWEQVGRLVNLQEMKNNDEDTVDRMRNLLIHLKNVKQ